MTEERQRERIVYGGFYSEWSGLQAVSINPWPVGSKQWDWWSEGADQAAKHREAAKAAGGE